MDLKDLERMEEKIRSLRRCEWCAKCMRDSLEQTCEEILVVLYRTNMHYIYLYVYRYIIIVSRAFFTKRIPVIDLTAQVKPFHRRRSSESDFAGFLVLGDHDPPDRDESYISDWKGRN